MAFSHKYKIKHDTYRSDASCKYRAYAEFALITVNVPLRWTSSY